MRNSVSVIIVNYNTCELLRDCLLSVYAQTKDLSFEVIVVDNNSSDSSKRVLENEFPQVKSIFSEVNLGFGKANNLGVKNSEGDFVFFLNSDTVLKNNAIKLFYDFMQKNESKLRIGALGCLLKNLHEDIGFSYGSFPTIKNEFFYILGKLKIRKIEDLRSKAKLQYFDVDFVSGAALFMRKDVFMEIDGFDSEIFLYYEETDLQKRLYNKNFRNIIITSPLIVHLEGGSAKSTKKISFNTLCFSQESMNYYIKKHFKGINYYLFRTYIIVDRLLFLPNKKLSFSETKKFIKILLK